MSSFHDEFQRAARPHGEVAGRGLAADAVIASSVEGIRKGRRRRAIGGVGAVAGIAVVAVGVWAVMPGAGGGLEPATPSEPVTAGPYRYDVDEVDPTNIAEPEVLLRGDDAVMCGDEVSLTPGVTVHDPQAFERGIFLEAELVTLGDVIEGEPPATPQPLDPENPDGPTNDWDPSESVWRGWYGGVVNRQVTTSLLIDGGSVVGANQGSMYYNTEEGPVGGSAGGPIPSVGYCEETELTWDRLRALEPGDPLDTLLVSQYWVEGDDGNEEVLATIVVDPNEPANTSTPPRDEPREDFPEPDETSGGGALDPVPDGQAELRLPDGDTYQAFVVPEPQVGCAPFADQLAAGQPGVHNFEYTVELPGVTESLTGELWGAEPIVTLPTGEEPWYEGLDAWIVAKDVSAGIQDPPLRWDDQVLASGSGASDPVRGHDCAYVEPIPEVSGAVFLVVDGVEVDAVEGLGSELSWAVGPSETHTWIYLGEATELAS